MGASAATRARHAGGATRVSFWEHVVDGTHLKRGLNQYFGRLCTDRRRPGAGILPGCACSLGSSSCEATDLVGGRAGGPGPPHYLCPSVAGASGVHYWTTLRGLRTVQARMTRRLGHWLPWGDQAWPDHARRTSRSADEAWRVATVPGWDKTVATTWLEVGRPLWQAPPQGPVALERPCRAMAGFAVAQDTPRPLPLGGRRRQASTWQGPSQPRHTPVGRGHATPHQRRDGSPEAVAPPCRGPQLGGIDGMKRLSHAWCDKCDRGLASARPQDALLLHERLDTVNAPNACVQDSQHISLHTQQSRSTGEPCGTRAGE